jgi:hypothetical protein
LFQSAAGEYLALFKDFKEPRPCGVHFLTHIGTKAAWSAQVRCSDAVERTIQLSLDCNTMYEMSKNTLWTRDLGATMELKARIDNCRL